MYSIQVYQAKEHVHVGGDGVEDKRIVRWYGAKQCRHYVGINDHTRFCYCRALCIPLLWDVSKQCGARSYQTPEYMSTNHKHTESQDAEQCYKSALPSPLSHQQLYANKSTSVAQPTSAKIALSMKLSGLVHIITSVGTLCILKVKLFPNDNVWKISISGSQSSSTARYFGGYYRNLA